MQWVVSHRRGSAHDLHHLEVSGDRREVLVMDVDAPTLALGSTQSPEALDPVEVARRGLAVTRRHSGGGLVLIEPGAMAWVDVVIAASDPLWRDDIGASFDWLGRAWASVVGGDPHRAAATHADLGKIVCFAGAGRGEVVVGGRKLVGLSQRRTRDWARFQCLVHRRFDPEATLGVLAPGLRSPRLDERVRTGVGVTDVTDVAERLVEALQQLSD